MAVRFLVDLILALPHRSMQPTRCAEGAGLDGGNRGRRTITCAVHCTRRPCQPQFHRRLRADACLRFFMNLHQLDGHDQRRRTGQEVRMRPGLRNPVIVQRATEPTHRALRKPRATSPVVVPLLNESCISCSVCRKLGLITRTTIPSARGRHSVSNGNPSAAPSSLTRGPRRL
jgi:hypothetical protein